MVQVTRAPAADPVLAEPLADAVVPSFTHRQILTVIGGLMAGMALASLDQTIVSTSLPTIVGELGGLDDISWVVSAYLLAETVSTPIYGKLSDVYGRRAMFRIAICVFLAGSMLCGLAPSLWALVLCRALQGLGAGGLVSMAFATLGDVIAPRERGRYTGWFSSVFAVTSVIGPLLGGFLTDHVSWRWIFYVNVPVGAVALVVTSRALRRLPTPVRTGRAPLDVGGAGLLIGAVSALLLALEWGGTEHPWTSPLIIGLLVGGVGLTAGWVAWERRAADPIVPLRLFRIDVVAVAGVLSFLVGVCMFGSVTYLPLFLQVVKGVSASSSGLLLVPLMLGVLAAATLYGRHISRVGRYVPGVRIGFLLVLVGLLLASRFGAGTPVGVVFVGMLVLGVGVGMLSPPLTLAVQNIVERADMGVATATNMFMRTMGASVGVAAFGSLFASRLGDASVRASLRDPSTIDALPDAAADAARSLVSSALHPVFFAGAGVALLGIVLATKLREVPLREDAAVSSH